MKSTAQLLREHADAISDLESAEQRLTQMDETFARVRKDQEAIVRAAKRCVTDSRDRLLRKLDV